MIAALALTGCSKLPFLGNGPDFDTSYIIDAAITCDKLEAKASVTRVSADEWEFAFTEPKELAGVTVTMLKNGYSASLGSLSFKADENAKYAQLPEIIAGAVNSLASIPAEELTRKDGVVTAETTFNGKKTVITADEKTGSLLTLNCPYHNLSVEFSNPKPYTSVIPDDGGLIISGTSGADDVNSSQ